MYLALPVLVSDGSLEKGALQFPELSLHEKITPKRSTSNLDFSDLVENIHPCKVGCFLQNDYFFNLHCDQS